MSTSRSNRRVIAQDTINTLKKGQYTNAEGKVISIAKPLKYAQRNTKIYSPEASAALVEAYPLDTPAFETSYQVTNESTLAAVNRLLAEGKDSVLALNFASAKNPGGGFLGGSQAQEESLARSTGLYPCLLEAEEYYTINRKNTSAFYTDYIIYSPLVPLIKDDAGHYLAHLQKASFITAPAVNTGVVKRQEAERIEEVPQVMKARLAKILAIAKENGHQQLVLGAWGCGVFQNEPQEVAQYFKEVLEGAFKGVFERVIFAIYAKEERFIKPFQELFG